LGASQIILTNILATILNKMPRLCKNES
jgi:hypothetical protein